MLDFTRKRVLVTGGTSGIGRAIAEAFSNAGANVLAIGLACEESLSAPIETHILDITDAGALHNLIRGVRVLHVVVNAAGTIRRDEEMSLDVFEKGRDGKLTAGMRVCMAARPKLIESSGSVVNIASMLSFCGSARAPAY